MRRHKWGEPSLISDIEKCSVCGARRRPAFDADVFVTGVEYLEPKGIDWVRTKPDCVERKVHS